MDVPAKDGVFRKWFARQGMRCSGKVKRTPVNDLESFVFLVAREGIEPPTLRI